jgi:hypothetical protein
MFDVTSSQADAWFAIFNVILFVGAFAVAVGTYGAIRMGEIKERFSNERLAANESATEQAKSEAARAHERTAELERDAALARERAAQLEKGVAESNTRAAEAQLALERFKAPRVIPDTEKPKMIAALTKFAPIKAAVYVIGDGPDPIGLGGSITDVLVKSRWDALMWTWSGVGGVVGVVVFAKPGSSADIEAATDGLVLALRAAHIDSVKEPWPGQWDTFGGMLNGPNPPSPTEPPIRVVIGTKPN